LTARWPSSPIQPFTILWHPFQLNPDMPAEGVDKRAYLEAKFGGKGRVDAVHDRLREVARKAGLPLNPDIPQRIPNTLDAHRLIHWAGIEGRQSQVVTALFRAYWAEGRDIGDAPGAGRHRRRLRHGPRRHPAPPAIGCRRRAT
jgi:predicted DsbA family dithiol-disulfide isomerase